MRRLLLALPILLATASLGHAAVTIEFQLLRTDDRRKEYKPDLTTKELAGEGTTIRTEDGATVRYIKVEGSPLKYQLALLEEQGVVERLAEATVTAEQSESTSVELALADGRTMLAEVTYERDGEGARIHFALPEGASAPFPVTEEVWHMEGRNQGFAVTHEVVYEEYFFSGTPLLCSLPLIGKKFRRERHSTTTVNHLLLATVRAEE